MSETNAGGWLAGRVYAGQISADGNQITFRGSPAMNYTAELRQGVRASFRINGSNWTQRRLKNLFIQQNQDIISPAQLLANAFALPPIAPAAAVAPPVVPFAAAPVVPLAAAPVVPFAAAPVVPPAPMANEFEQEGQLEIAEVLLDLQNFRDRRAAEEDTGAPDREVGQKNKRAGKRTKRKRPKRKTNRRKH